MAYQSPKSPHSNPSIHLRIVDSSDNLLTNNSGSGSMFEPRGESNDPRETADDSNGNSTSSGDKAPEKKLTLFALQLALLEKTASGIGTVGFIWATVVLLGGFAITLDKIDFWFVSIILLIEGTRIFGRSHELEWQHQSTWTLSEAGRFSFRVFKSGSNLLKRTLRALFRPSSVLESESYGGRQRSDSTHLPESNFKSPQSENSGSVKGSSSLLNLIFWPNSGNRTETNVENGVLNEAHVSDSSAGARRSMTRTWPESDVPLLPYPGWVFLSRNISRILYWLQLCSASACVSLSLYRLIKQDFGEVAKGDSDKKNRKSALNIFYSLALAEALFFLLEKAYWEWKISYKKLLEEVNGNCKFDKSAIIWVKRFFYDSYSRCVNGSIFDGLQMDLVSFASELLLSDSSDEQLAGAQILQVFVTRAGFSDDTLRKIGTSKQLLERLIEMLNWTNPQEEQVRKFAAEIVSKLAGKKQNSLRVAGIPGSLESISSLLYTGRNSGFSGDEIHQRNIVPDTQEYEYSKCNLLGLAILKKLANDHDNCGKIGNTRGLLAKVIEFTHAGEGLLRNSFAPDSQIKTVRRSLQLVKKLAFTSGNTGKILRQEISEIVFTISNIRDILRYGECHIMLQELGIDILSGLALDDDAKERIGSTGGVIRQLFHVFFTEGLPDLKNPAAVASGEAIAMLALENERNCDRILRLGVVEKLVESLNDPVLSLNSARILRNLCAYGGDDCFIRLRRVTAAAPTVIESIMKKEKKTLEVIESIMKKEKKSLEVAIGLAAQIFKFMDSSELNARFKQTRIKKTAFAERLVQILKIYDPSTDVPRIRRFAIELAISTMKVEETNVEIFRKLNLRAEVERVAETTCDLECYNVFSGTVGLCRHRIPMHELAVQALDFLCNGQNPGTEN